MYVQLFGGVSALLHAGYHGALQHFLSRGFLLAYHGLHKHIYRSKGIYAQQPSAVWQQKAKKKPFVIISIYINKNKTNRIKRTEKQPCLGARLLAFVITFLF